MYNKWSLSQSMVNWDERTIDISNEPIVIRVMKFLEDKLNVKLTCNQAQIQIWPKGSRSDLHVHEEGDREVTDFNSLIYLNNDYEGGEFYTGDGFVYKPSIGALTFFNGRIRTHGVKDVHKAHRYTLIFWWKNTVLGL